jgi:hypothetical protein
VIAYTKNHNLGLEVPYRYGSENRKYLPDFIALVDDGHGPNDPLHLVTEIKGYRREDAKEKKSTMDSYWIPGVNHLGSFGRWAFAEFTEVYQIESDFEAKVETEFAKMIEAASGHEFTPLTTVLNRAEACIAGQFGRQSKRRGGEVDDAVEANLSVHGFQARNPEARRFVVFLRFLLVLALQFFVVSLFWFFTIAVVRLVVDHQDVLHAHQVGGHRRMR